MSISFYSKEDIVLTDKINCLNYELNVTEREGVK